MHDYCPAGIPTRAPFFVWLCKLYSSPVKQAHGRTLVEELDHWARGRFATFPADADDDLRRAERDGWIVRGTCNPTASQAAFAGLTYKKIPSCYASCFWWLRADNGTPGYESAQAWMNMWWARLDDPRSTLYL